MEIYRKIFTANVIQQKMENSQEKKFPTTSASFLMEFLSNHAVLHIEKTTVKTYSRKCNTKEDSNKGRQSLQEETFKETGRER